MAIKAIRRVDRQFITEEVRTELMGNTLLSVKALRWVDSQFITEEVRTEYKLWKTIFQITLGMLIKLYVDYGKTNPVTKIDK